LGTLHCSNCSKNRAFTVITYLNELLQLQLQL
jgi:hypothetical protein